MMVTEPTIPAKKDILKEAISCDLCLLPGLSLTSSMWPLGFNARQSNLCPVTEVQLIDIYLSNTTI